MKSRPLWGIVFTLLGVTFLCGLGTWQLQRLAWKNAIIEALEVAYAHPADIPDAAAIRKIAAQKNAYAYGSVEGVYALDRSMLLIPRTREGRPGAHVITPLTLAGGEILLVDRGWVPAGTPAADMRRPQGGAMLRVTGLLRPPSRGNAFTPANPPDGDEIYRARPEDFGALPLILQAAAEDPSPPGPVRPRPPEVLWRPANNHFSYALFWFGMAAVLAVISLLRFHKKA